MKFSSIVYTTPLGYESFKDAVITLAEYEGFPAHANALKLRSGTELFRQPPGGLPIPGGLH
jgi:histidinol dehydrogenase